MGVTTHLNFEGRAEEALAFYQRVLGAQVTMLVRCKDAPPPPQGFKPGTENKILHAVLTIGGTVLMATDGYNSGHAAFKGFSLSIEAQDAQDATRLFAGLSEGGSVMMPLGKTFFSPCFGMVTDAFGVSWMVIVLPAQ
jgi:PhnB protein